MDRPKAVVTRAALERVLARAAELQNASGEDGGRHADALTEAQVEEVAKEVGLSTQFVRQALAEERARIAPVTITGSGIGYQLFGVDRVACQRVVRGKPDRVLSALGRWMKDEGLKIMRQQRDFIIWEPAKGVFESIRRAFGDSDYALTRTNEVTATVAPVDDEFTVVRLEAVLASFRAEKGHQTIVTTVFGGASTGALLLMGVMVPVAIVPAIVIPAATYFGSRRSHQHALQRATLALEQALDRLERGEGGQPSLLRMIEAALPPTR